MNPSDRKYSKDHEWAQIVGNEVIVGITDFAQQQLGDIVYVDLPEVGSNLDQSSKLGEVESVKAVSDIFSPVGGKVIEVNQAVIDSPELVNQDPSGSGWLVKLALRDESSDFNSLLTSEEYDELIENEAH
jgi:glycine cleavage system H protein